MRNSKLVLAGLFSFLTGSFLVAQSGIIRGTVIEDSSGEPLFGVTIQIKDTSIGAITDFDGKFEIRVDPGTYELQASFVGFQAITVSALLVEDSEVTVIDQIRLKENVGVLEEIVVTAEVIKTTEAALLTVKRKSANLIDGISSASFKKIGDSDAAGAVKRVTGVSVEGGKYVYVRGLGDRYTKTMLNSVDIPGLDPDRNSLQIDIFPTNLINNMIVLKSAVAEMPADFTGGVVNIETKDFPDEKILEASLGITFNPSMNFQNDFLAIDGSDTDWLGFDTDLRDLPPNALNVPIPIQNSDQEVFDFNNNFSPILAGMEETSFLNYSFGFSVGNQISLNNGNKLGFILSTTYKSDRILYDDQEYGEYQVPDPSDPNDELVAATITDGELTSKNLLLGGLGGLAYKTNNSKYRFTALHLQNGEAKTGRFFVTSDPDDGRDALGKSDFEADDVATITYTERGLTNFLLNGEHHLSDDSWVIDWRISPTFSTLDDPDIRRSAFTTVSGGFVLDPPELDAGAAGFPRRIWRELEETNVVGRLDVTKNAELFGRDAKYKAGVYYTFKERDYRILEYNLAFFGSQPTWTSNDPNIILLDENLYPNSGNAYFQDGNSNPNSNEYNSTVNNLAYYVSAEINPAENLKAIFGLRVEDFTQKHTGRDQEAAVRIQNEVDAGATNGEALLRQLQEEGFNILEDDEVLDAVDLFPSLNLIYALNEKQNLRFSYSRTIARPSFKELSFAQIIDPISDRIFNGGLFVFEGNWEGNLSETLIDNFDLRWELFQERGQIFSVSVFYKSFDDPIELVRIREAQTTNEFQPRNVGSGEVYGGEFEFRKNLGFISPSLKKITLNGNVTITESILDMQEVEFQARQDFARPGEDIDDTREMAGQAPYVINAGIGYEDYETGLDAGFFYNIQGPTLVVVGGAAFPDVETEPFHSLNFNLNKSFGENEGLSLGFSVTNILDDRREEFYENEGSSDQVFTGFSPGVSFGVSLGYKF
ncbi:MAG: TonB-dependent receptor [Bacteroidota bacterium]